jgi:cation diffusion facilitator family transporter
MMDANSLERWRHDHDFLGVKHGAHERRTWAVVALTTVMMIAEIGGGAWSGSMALIADGLHMSTHVAALSIAALAYSFARRHVGNDWFSFGTGKIGELAAFASAVILAMVALLIGYESVMRVIHPVTIAFREAIPIALLGLGVNLVSAFLLHDHDHHGHADHDHEAEFEEAHDHDHDHDHGHDHDHDHDHDHHHDHDDGDHHAHHADYNFRAAYFHVLADAVTSLLAISALVAAAYFDLPWLDPVAGFLGTIVITVWAYSLIKSAAAVLLDAVPSRSRAGLIRQRLEIENDRVTDLHVWRLGPGHLGVVAVIVSEHPRAPDHYKARLAGIEGLSHVSIEVNPYPAAVADRLRAIGGVSP